MQCYYCILMIKELKMIIKEPLWEDIIDWGIIEYDQTQYDDLRQHERLIHQISSTNTAIIFSMGTGGMGLQVFRDRDHGNNSCECKPNGVAGMECGGGWPRAGCQPPRPPTQQSGGSSRSSHLRTV